MEKKKKEKKVEKAKPEVTEKTRKTMLTFFIMLFPTLIIVLLLANLPIQVYAIALFFYQAILIRNFIGDHYRSID